MPTPAFVETKRLLQQAATDMGERLSSRQAHHLARVCWSIWSGDETPDLVEDPTAREAIRRVLARLDQMEAAA